jgi:hypothetical protein
VANPVILYRAYAINMSEQKLVSKSWTEDRDVAEGRAAAWATKAAVKEVGIEMLAGTPESAVVSTPNGQRMRIVDEREADRIRLSS